MGVVNVSEEQLAARLLAAVGRREPAPAISVVGSDRLASAFDVTALAVASIANAAVAARRVRAIQGGNPAAPIVVDRQLANVWFASTIAPIGWQLPPIWDSIAGIYPCGSGFVRLHTNAPHHKSAALAVLGCGETRPAVTAAVGAWDPRDLESAVVDAGGVASALRSRDEWMSEPPGAAIHREALVHTTVHDGGRPAPRHANNERPLDGVRVLDLTRVLAGPVATRLLAGLGADVLRIDPPVWDEAGVAAEVNLGKRCARLDLDSKADRDTFESLLGEADVMVHGYRRDALAGLGYGDDERRRINPHLVDVSLNAWGHSGPWADRRGFDSIVQIASGIAHQGMVAFGLDEPKPLPVQALDHATGYTLAACALHGWADRLEQGHASTWKTSLAAHAELLWPTVATATPMASTAEPASPGPGDDGLATEVEVTTWGPVRRARPPLHIQGIDLGWATGSANHGTSPATWSE